jgi:hypothetical protein
MGYILARMASVDSQLALEVLLSEPDGGMCSLLTLLASLVSPQATCRPSSQLLIAVAGLLTSFMAQAVDQAAVLGGLPQLLRVLGLLVAASDSRGRQPYQDSVLDKDEVLFGVFQGVQAAMETFLAASTAEDVNDSEQAAVEALCRLLASLVQRAKTRCALFTAVAQAVAAVGNGLFSKWDHVVKQELSAAVRDAGRIPLPDFCNALESDVFK